MDLSVLGGLSPEVFLRDYWQKKPLLVRGAFPGFESPLSPEELLALACRDGMYPRLILENAGEYPWELLAGPFEPEELHSLPDRGWTILVGDVNRCVPAAAALLDPFRFLPNWRIDDVQVSYAPPGGNAGPHVDNYDVFLVQGYGQRRWQISCTPAPGDAAFVPDADVAILATFVPDAEWILSPGDMLYLPPRLPHWGVAVNHCMTYSVGFRAPVVQDLLHGLLVAAGTHADSTTHFGDAGRKPAEHPGLIDADDLAWVRRKVWQFLANGDDIDRLFGRFITQPGEALERPAEDMSAPEVRRLLVSGGTLRRAAIGFLAHIEGSDRAHLYACGQEYVLGGRLVHAARLVTGTQPLTYQTLNPYLDTPAFADMLAELINMGCLAVNSR